ncbi:NUDIX hydrolase [Pseudophaeobacter flagellatus]|uniref:NUDIX hydrolase n=1 Tax=Pseudophaeobacter flagellatus TaxID=2899119 RepID=UPI001E58C69C|nr:NUDIX hydrolase [Pseudophaeobacter flagellatus]MCD9147029.1 NUDIX hydrolase [Pseudophaeobacter flagellatus]
MIRRFGERPRLGQNYRMRPGVYAILPRDGQVLLTRQLEPGPEIQLPGGGIDPGESPLPALHREVFEETGWSIAAPRRLGAFRRYTFMPEYDLWAEKICQIYVARPLRRLGPPAESQHQAVWLAPQDVISCLGNPGDRHFAQQYFCKR